MSEGQEPAIPPTPQPHTAAPLPSLNIKVRDDTQNEVTFRVKYSTPLEKIINAYCERQGAARDSLRFFFDGLRLNGGETPRSLEMEDDNMIDVHQMQEGGNQESESPEQEEVVKEVFMHIKVQDQSQGEVEFRVKQTTQLGKVMAAYCKTKEIDIQSVRFYFHGTRLLPSDTAKGHGIENGGVVQAMLEQQGGAQNK